MHPGMAHPKFPGMRPFPALPSLCLAACLAACLAPDATAPAGNGESEMPAANGRELGTLVAIYPFPRKDGGYDLELRLTRDTILAAYEDIRVYASDSIGRAVLRSAREPFYTRDGRCFFNPKKELCLPFRPAAD